MGLHELGACLDYIALFDQRNLLSPDVRKRDALVGHWNSLSPNVLLCGKRDLHRLP